MRERENTNITIKTATVRDAHIISRIHAESWKYAYKGIVPRRYLAELQWDRWVSACQEWLQQRTHKTNILHEDGMPAGCVTYGKPREEAFAGWGEVVAIYMLPEFLGRGYGRQLLDYALEELRRHDYAGCYLWVLEKNERGRRFYNRAGFSWNGDTTEVEIQNKKLNELRYTMLF